MELFSKCKDKCFALIGQCKSDCQEVCTDCVSLFMKHKKKAAFVAVFAVAAYLYKPVWVALHCFWHSL